MAVRSGLHRAGLRFRKDHPVRTSELLVRPDVVFTRQRVAVFIDGCFWHSCPIHGNQPKVNAGYWEPKLARTRARDRRVTASLTAAGWMVLRAWEHEKVEETVTRVLLAVAASSSDVGRRAAPTRRDRG